MLALGLAPGPRVGALLRTVRAWWLAGGCTADAASCRAELSRQIDTQYAQIDNAAQIDHAAQIDIAAQIDHAAQIDNAAQTDKPEQIDTATQTDAAVTNHE